MMYRWVVLAFKGQIPTHPHKGNVPISKEDLERLFSKYTTFYNGLDQEKKLKFAKPNTRIEREVLRLFDGGSDSASVQGGANAATYVIHHGRKYKVHQGKRGGQYIVAKGNKVYVTATSCRS
jgi:hypothetical protein